MLKSETAVPHAEPRGPGRETDLDLRKANVSLVAVSVFLATHVTIVLHVAFGEILSDVVVVLNVG